MRRSSSTIAAPAPNTSCSASRTSTQRGHAAALAHLRQLQRLLARGQRPPRDLELQIERAQPEVGRRATCADDGRQHGAPAPLGRQQLRARGFGGAPVPAPEIELPADACRRRGSPRRCGPASCRAAGVRPPPASTSAPTRRILIGAGDPELRLRLSTRAAASGRRRSARAPSGSAPAAARPGTRPTTWRRRATGPAGAARRRESRPASAASASL